jgi:hypothetical protein
VPEFDVCETTDFRTESIDKGIAHGREIAEKVLRNYPAPPPDSTAFPD